MDKTKVVFIYGAPAVGKLTTAGLLAEQTGYKLLHNHLTTDLVRSVFDQGDATGGNLILKFRLEMIEAAVKAGVKGLIVTGVYAKDFTYPTGKTDEWFVREIEKMTEESGGEFYAVNLIADKNVLMERVKGEERLKWKKIHDTKTLEEVLSKHDFVSVAPVKNNIIIDTTDLKVEETVSKIVEFIEF